MKYNENFMEIKKFYSIIIETITYNTILIGKNILILLISFTEKCL